jgi:hypothetical protein
MKQSKEIINGVSVQYRGMEQNSSTKLSRMIMFHWHSINEIDFLRWDDTPFLLEDSIVNDFVICIFKLKK